MPAGRSLRSAAVDDYALVLNAGSSSLKFCVFKRPADGAWRLEARGQIEGIGTAPHLSVKDGGGKSLANENVARAMEPLPSAALSAWLKSHYGGARVVGVGHRVVHGGARFDRPTIINAQVMTELRALIPLAPAAPAAQPGRHRSHNGAVAHRAAGGVFRHEFPPLDAAGGATRSVAGRRSRSGRPALRFSRPVV